MYIIYINYKLIEPNLYKNDHWIVNCICCVFWKSKIVAIEGHTLHHSNQWSNVCCKTLGNNLTVGQ